MNKRFLVGSAIAATAGLGLVALLSARRRDSRLSAGDADGQWTPEDMPDLAGKVIIVTGANSGIGFEAAKEFARKGAHTILACRNMDKAQAALSRIKDEVPDASAETMQLDLASLESIESFAETFKASHERLDILLNNAGIMMVPYGKTEDGFERQLGTNHLGHFALTGLLIDVLMATPGARVVNVSSMAHRSGEMDFDNLMFDDGRGYSPVRAYGRSKLANLLFTHELQRRFALAGSSAIAVSAHPGLSDTNLAHHFEDRWYFRAMKPLMSRLGQDAWMGALPSMRASADPQVEGGAYLGPAGYREIKGYPILVESNGVSNDADAARRLWAMSEELTGVRYMEPEHQG